MFLQLSGKVIRGDGYGKTLGFPTANIDRRDFVRKKLKIKLGIYAGCVTYKLKTKNYKLKAGIVIGPLDSRHLPKIEAHILNFKGNLYGKKIIIQLQKYLRPFKKYKNILELKKQIQKDILKINKLK
jgi:FAD synthase